MKSDPVLQLEIRGRKFDVYVFSSGEFSAEYNGQDVRALSLEQLKTKLEKACSRDRIEPIEFIEWLGYGGGLGHAKCTGIHASTGNLIIVRNDDRLSSTGRSTRQEHRVNDAIPPELEAEYRPLCEAVQKAEAARLAFERAHCFDLREAIETAAAKKPKAGGAA